MLQVARYHSTAGGRTTERGNNAYWHLLLVFSNCAAHVHSSAGKRCFVSTWAIKPDFKKRNHELYSMWYQEVTIMKRISRQKAGEGCRTIKLERKW